MGHKLTKLIELAKRYDESVKKNGRSSTTN